MQIPVAVAILVKNEERALPACLNALVPYFQEVYVIDSQSTDASVQIAKSAGAHVLEFKWNGAYPKKKQWVLDNLPTDLPFVLLLDADEVLTPELRREIATLDLDDAGLAAAEIDLLYHFDGRMLRHGHRVRKRALVHRHRAHFPVMDDLHVARMWEVEGHYQPVVTPGHKILQLAHSIEHRDPDPLYDYFERHNRYSDWEAQLRLGAATRHAVRQARSRQGEIFDRLPAKALAFFVYSFFLRRGFLDGKAGFNYAIALSFYYWQISLKARAFRASERGVSASL